ncbi:TRAP transporter large permease [Marispirochaeta aestuarii]|uniref:TRAP transporter large permease n=1 Tax=Marispirochaeta aestuarii TaxID=1963862 RepID=UPI0029C8A1C3|nr:TRAP transporter large permease [Marispirochaeta aestuarii]
MIFDPAIVGILLFGGLILLIVLRIPVAYALALAVVPVLLVEPRLTPVMLLQRMLKSYDSFILLSVPFFIMAANVMNASGITNKLIRFSKALVGHLPGGLAHVNVVVSMFFAGISGSSTADAAGIGSVLIPAMIKEKYDRFFTVAVTACSSVMGVIIPPSIIMVVWGGVSNTSVAALFLAGFVPGVMVALSQMGLVHIFSIKRKYPKEHAMDWKELGLSFKAAILPGITPVIIIGGIVGGFVTPTEASLLAVAYALFLALFVYRTIKPGRVSGLLLETAKLGGLSLFAVGTASIYGWVLAYYRLPAYMVEAIGYITSSPTVMLFIIVGLFLIVGTFMDAIPAIVIMTPLLMPLAEHAGIHPLHYAISGIVALSFGLITPPYGLCLLISSEIGGINSMDAIKEVGIFLAIMLLVLSAIVVFPGLTMFLPRLFMPEFL